VKGTPLEILVSNPDEVAITTEDGGGSSLILTLMLTI